MYWRRPRASMTPALCRLQAPTSIPVTLTPPWLLDLLLTFLLALDGALAGTLLLLVDAKGAVERAGQFMETLPDWKTVQAPFLGGFPARRGASVYLCPFYVTHPIGAPKLTWLAVPDRRPRPRRRLTHAPMAPRSVAFARRRTHKRQGFEPIDTSRR